MENKNIENKLQEAADNIEVREFSLVWEEIKHEIKPAKRKRFVRWVPIAATAACAIIACSIIIPIALQQNQTISGGNAGTNIESSQPLPSPPQGYFEDDLILSETTPQDFFSQLSIFEIDFVDVSNYITVSSYLSRTSEQIVKGGYIELTDDLENSTFYLSIEFYDESVKTNPILDKYEMDFLVGDTVIEYRVKESYPEDGIYIYDIKANSNSVNYIMEYTCFTEDIKPFLETFFK